MDLHIKYRPKTFEDVVGQDEAVHSLKTLTSKDAPHLFLFSGDSGVGKTTLARIIASAVNCDKNNILEIDAATNSGVNDMRDISNMARYRAVGDSPNRMVIIDECHALSNAAWQSLLKITEQPPEHLYFCLCTTELGKVPKTIKTRAHAYGLKPVESKELLSLVKSVAKLEGIKLKKGTATIIAKNSGGSARQALVYLSMCRGLRTLDEVKKLVSSVSGDDAIINLYRGLVNGIEWREAIKIVKGADVNFESARISLMHYMSKVVENASGERAEMCLAVMDAFSKPFNRSTEKPEFILALGKVLLADD